jgi:hypothetical protein
MIVAILTSLFKPSFPVFFLALCASSFAKDDQKWVWGDNNRDQTNGRLNFDRYPLDPSKPQTLINSFPERVATKSTRTNIPSAPRPTNPTTNARSPSTAQISPPPTGTHLLQLSPPLLTVSVLFPDLEECTGASPLEATAKATRTIHLKATKAASSRGQYHRG